MIKILAAAAVLASTGAAAQSITVFANSPEGLGANSIMNGDYVSAEKQIQSADVSPFDPARQINLGVVLAMTGRGAEAQKLFAQSVDLLETNYPGSAVLLNAKARLAGYLARRGQRAVAESVLSSEVR